MQLQGIGSHKAADRHDMEASKKLAGDEIVLQWVCAGRFFAKPPRFLMCICPFAVYPICAAYVRGKAWPMCGMCGIFHSYVQSYVRILLQNAVMCGGYVRYFKVMCEVMCNINVYLFWKLLQARCQTYVRWLCADLGTTIYDSVL